MEISLNFSENITLCAYLVEPTNPKKFIIFLSGGSKVIGKDRFKNWQDDFGKEGIGSISFDFSGVGKSSGKLNEQSLEKRISEAKFVAEWIEEKYPSMPKILFGVSMGSYIALALTQYMDRFKKLIIQVPAAYSSKAQNLSFDHKFTEELRKENGWNDSPSFAWLEKFSGDTLLIAAEKDEVIPQAIIERYKEIGGKKSGFKFLSIPNAPHNIWKKSDNTALYLREAYDEIRRIIGLDN